LVRQSAKPSPLAPLPQERGTRNLIFLPFSCGRRGWGMRGESKYINAFLRGAVGDLKQFLNRFLNTRNKPNILILKIIKINQTQKHK
jgi:hypothetical protein